MAKNMAFEEKGAAMGHNKPSDKDKMDTVKKFLKIEEEIDKLKEEQKDVLNEAKKRGHLKGALRGAAKILRMSEETHQAKNEVEHETKYIVQLFANKDGQYSFLKEDEAA